MTVFAVETYQPERHRTICEHEFAGGKNHQTNACKKDRQLSLVELPSKRVKTTKDPIVIRKDVLTADA